jgi:PKD repeat protein
LSYNWRFGDGYQAGARTVSHWYSATSATVTLSVVDKKYQVYTVSKTISPYVTSSGVAP